MPQTSGPMKMKPHDPRPAFRGWAPGGYNPRCARCGQRFSGDKRAWECADCAYGAREPAQDEPAAGVGPLKVTPESMATQLESVASVLVARLMPAESAVCMVGAEMIRALTPPAAPDPLRPGLMAADDLLARHGWPIDGAARQALRAEIARRGA